MYPVGDVFHATRELERIRNKHIIGVTRHFCPAVVQDYIVVADVSKTGIYHDLSRIEEQRFGHVAS